MTHWHKPKYQKPASIRQPLLLCLAGARGLAITFTDTEGYFVNETYRGAPYHPQTQGKIERWHQTLKNRIMLENYFLPGDLERQIESFVAYYNHQRYHESLTNLTPADVYFGRGLSILEKRERIKKKTIAKRRLHYQRHAA